MFAASNFEFKYRFWIFGALFWIAFASYSVDHLNIVQAVLEWNARGHGATAPDWHMHAIFAVGALFCSAAALLRTWATAYLHAEVMVDMQMHTSRLVADGPYRDARNPRSGKYSAGHRLWPDGQPPWVLYSGGRNDSLRLSPDPARGGRNSPCEGDSYRAYCAAVPRLLPSLGPRLPAAGRAATWSDGFLGEAFMWVLAASVAAFAITLNLKLFYIVLGSAFLVYAICYLFIRSRRKGDAGGHSAS